MQLLAGARRARRQYSATGEVHHQQSHKALKNRLKKTMRKESRNSWRHFLEEVTSDITKLHNQGLWYMSKWSRRVAGETPGDPYLFILRRTEQDQYINNNREKTKILAERFFPGMY